MTQENQSVSVPRNFKGLLEILHNDFETVVFHQFPEMESAKSALQNAGAQGALMSGSGSAVFGLFETRLARERAFQRLSARPNWKIFTVEN